MPVAQPHLAVFHMVHQMFVINNIVTGTFYSLYCVRRSQFPLSLVSAFLPRDAL